MGIMKDDDWISKQKSHSKVTRGHLRSKKTSTIGLFLVPCTTWPIEITKAGAFVVQEPPCFWIVTIFISQANVPRVSECLWTQSLTRIICKMKWNCKRNYKALVQYRIMNVLHCVCLVEARFSKQSKQLIIVDQSKCFVQKANVNNIVEQLLP